MPRCTFWFLLLSLRLAGQASLSGTINQYVPVTSLSACAGWAIVDAPSFIEAGDTLLLFQMQGAAINAANTAAFGTIEALGPAGRYEQVSVTAVNGDTVQFSKTLLYDDYQPGAGLQLISFPYYEDAVVEGALTAAPWDGQSGGVLAFRADTLRLLADIDVSGKGFRGGRAGIDYDGNCTWLINYNDFRFAGQSIRGGEKGEGIAGFPGGFSRGRGPAGNGGGGGNDHNAGGGGGALFSRGGIGGENDNPSFFGCQGRSPGEPGRNIPATTGRLFMGGGGGAGHDNNEVGTAGGNGGGIALIVANAILGNGNAISANGGSAATAGGDGAGGGGAGGTILLLVSGESTALSCQAVGGAGGHTDNNNQEQCFGPGGGGSGGAVAWAGPVANVQLSGGAAGLSQNSAACPESPNGAMAGEAGALLAVEGIPLSIAEIGSPPELSLSVPDTLLACADTLVLSAEANGSLTELQWEADTGNGFLPLQNGPAYQGVNTLQLQLLNPQGEAGHRFRLYGAGNCFGEVFSGSVYLAQGQPPAANFSWQVSGLSVSFANLSSPDAAAYTWDFGDGGSSTSAEPQYTYTAPGLYEVALAVEHACGADTLSRIVAVGDAPTAGIGILGINAGCAPLAVFFENQSSGLFETLEWSFPGGDPAQSAEASPVVVYTGTGVFPATLQAAGPLGADTVVRQEAAIVYERPAPAFDWSISGLEVAFENTSAAAVSYSWNFGDGSTSNAESPVHTYAEAGAYQVTLNALNPNCAQSVTRLVLVSATAVEEAGGAARVLAPNPSSGLVCLAGGADVQLHLPWALFNAQGQTVSKGHANGPCWDFSHLPRGRYFLKVEGMGLWTLLLQ